MMGVCVPGACTAVQLKAGGRFCKQENPEQCLDACVNMINIIMK